jgi:hypothetical protein
LVWFGLVWFGLVWFGLVWFGLVWFFCSLSQGQSCDFVVDHLGPSLSNLL